MHALRRRSTLGCLAQSWGTRSSRFIPFYEETTLSTTHMRPISSFSTTTQAPTASESVGDLLTESFPEHGVLKLTLNRPKQRNALSYGLLSELKEALLSLESGPLQEHRCVVLGANGPVFSSGHDLKELMRMRAGDHSRSVQDTFALCSEVMQLVQRVPQPIIAAVDGVATAAGCQLVATCDLAVVSHASTFATPGVKIGLFCSTPAVALSRAIGRKAAMDMLLTGRSVPADEARQLGLVSHIAQAPEEAAFDLAKDIAAVSGVALAIGKRGFYSQIEEDDICQAYAKASEAMVTGMTKADAEEGISAFIEKRTPVWRHR